MENHEVISRRFAVRILFAATLVLLAVAPSGASIPYASDPDWLSFEFDDFGTGCDFADVNTDRFLDLAVSNGNDMLQAPNYVYLNQAGSLPMDSVCTKYW